MLCNWKEHYWLNCIYGAQLGNKLDLLYSSQAMCYLTLWHWEQLWINYSNIYDYVANIEQIR